MERHELISVIIPVYNAEKYLSEMLESVTHQTYNNLEIILIDDASSDDSPRICKEYADNDSRIRVIIKEHNEGVSDARNLGITLARGTYLGFVDADDICDLRMFQQLHDAIIESQTDIALCMYNDLIGKNLTKREEPLRGGYFTKKEVLDEIIFPMVGTPKNAPACAPVMGSLCRCLFKKSIINADNPIRMRKMRFAEDLQFVLEYLVRCDSAYVIEEALYHYRSNPESATHKYAVNMENDIRIQLEILKAFLVENHLFYSKMIEYYNNTLIYNILWCISNEAKIENPDSFNHVVKRIKHLRNEPSFCKVFKWDVIKYMNSKERIYVSLVKLRLYPLVILFNRR